MRPRTLVLLFAAVLISLCLRSVVLAQPATPGKLTLAAYNVEWMTDVFDDPYTADEIKPPKPRKDLTAVASAIRSMNADVVSFEELENEGILRAFVSEMLGDMGYKHIAAGITNSQRGQNLGIISRVPIVSVTSHRFRELSLPAGAGQPIDPDTGKPQVWRFARDLMQVRLQVTPTHTLDVFVVHLKSKHDSPGDKKSANWRLAEAGTAREIIAGEIKANPDRWIAIMGDFNDTLDSPTIKHLLSPAADGKSVLQDSQAGLPFNDRLTYLKSPYKKEGPIDYILVNPSLARRMVPGSVKVLSDKAADPSLLTGSDHAPISVTFDVGSN